MSSKQPGATRAVPRCPVCGRPREERFRPFCSARCRDVDLARWLDGRYAIPVVESEPDGDEGVLPEAGEREGRRAAGAGGAAPAAYWPRLQSFWYVVAEFG